MFAKHVKGNHSGVISISRGQLRGLCMNAIIVGFLCAGALALRADDPSPETLQTWWQELRDTDSAKAYRALWSFVKNPDAAVAYIGKNLKPVPADMALIERL